MKTFNKTMELSQIVLGGLLFWQGFKPLAKIMLAKTSAIPNAAAEAMAA